MKISNFSLVEKNVKLEPNVAISRNKLSVSIHRENEMPKALIEDQLPCAIKVSIKIENEEKIKLMTASVTYFIIASEIIKYNCEETADEIFSHLRFLFVEKINELVKDVNLPPIPPERFNV